MFERSSEILWFGPFRLVPGDGLWRGEDGVPLPPRALAVLQALAARPGQLVSKGELLDAAWKDAFVTEASLLEAIHVLRAALGDDRRAPAYIQTVHRRGYRFVAAVSRAAHHLDPQPATVEPVATSPTEFPPFFSGPEWRMIVRRCGVAAAATVVTGMLLALFSPRPVELSPGHYAITLPAPLRVPPFTGAVSASPDGRRFAFVGIQSGQPALFIRDAVQPEPTRVPDRDDPSDPFFSPDGRVVGYFAGGQLKIAEAGYAARTVAYAAPGAGATWIGADTIVFGGGPGGGLARVHLSGGPPEVLVQPRALSPDVRFGWPDALPDGGLLFTVITPTGSDIAVLDPGASRHRVLVHDAAFGRYAPTGHLVVARHGRLAAAPFDLTRRAITGPFRAVVDDVASAGAFEGPRYAFSRSGSLVYVPGLAGGPVNLRWRTDRGAAAAPFEDRLTIAPADSDPGVAPVAAPAAVNPAWRTDGLEVAFAANKTGPFNLFVRPREGGPELPLDPSPWNQVPTSWSPDGRRLAFTEFNPATGADVWVLDRATGTRLALARTPFDETGARYSPDGRWLAYLSKATGEWQVTVVPATGGAAQARFPVRHLAGDADPIAGTGRELRIVLAWFTELSRQMRGPV